MRFGWRTCLLDVARIVIIFAPFPPKWVTNPLNSQSGEDHHTVDNFGDNRHNPLLQMLFFRVTVPKVDDRRLGEIAPRAGARQ